MLPFYESAARVLVLVGFLIRSVVGGVGVVRHAGRAALIATRSTLSIIPACLACTGFTSLDVRPFAKGFVSPLYQTSAPCVATGITHVLTG